MGLRFGVLAVVFTWKNITSTSPMYLAAEVRGVGWRFALGILLQNFGIGIVIGALSMAHRREAERIHASSEHDEMEQN
jgi:hypothetical protein